MEEVRATQVRVGCETAAPCESCAVSGGAWVSVKEYAAMKGISERAVQKAIAKGKHQVKEVPHPKRADQTSFLIWNGEPVLANQIDEPNGEPVLANQFGEPTGEPVLANQIDEPNGEPVLANQFGEPEEILTKSKRVKEEIDSVALPGLGDVGDADLGFAKATPQAMECRPSGTDISEQIAKRQDDASTIKANPTVIEYVPYHKLDEAQLYALFMDEVSRRLRDAESKTDEWAAITAAYNAGELVGELKKLKGMRSERALRLWWQKWNESKQDMFTLIHKNTAQVRGRKVSFLEEKFLTGALLCGWEKPVMTAIRELKAQASMGVLESDTSVATLKRWCNDFAEDNPAIWCQGRRGDKAVKDTIVKSIDRDDTSIKPLQVFVVDGHTLSVFVKHPITGKAFRPTLIMVYDWGSRYPVGMSLALSEDSQHTLVAFRNAFLHAGVLPYWAYLDNGKAFRSKLFNQAWEEHDLEKEFAGIFPRLGIEQHFARSYNARAKVVERFFGTMQNQWEKRQKSYCGAGIHNKPAHMARNEKWMQEMYGAQAMDYNECMDSIYEWIRYEYGMAVHQTLKAKPYEVFMQAERAEDRQFEKKQLDILLLTVERKRLREEGIILNKNRYWAPELVEHIGKSVVVRYDYNDLGSILVYDLQSRFICQAELRESQCGWVAAEKDNPMAAQRLYAEDREISNIQKRIKRDTKRLVEGSKRVIEAEVAKHQEIISGRKAEIRENNPAFRQGRMMPAVEKQTDVNEEVAKLERQAAASLTAENTEGTETLTQRESGEKQRKAEGTLQDAAATKVIVLEELLAEAEESEAALAEAVSFEKMQKIIGLQK